MEGVSWSAQGKRAVGRSALWRSRCCWEAVAARACCSAGRCSAGKPHLHAPTPRLIFRGFSSAWNGSATPACQQQKGKDTGPGGEGQV